MLDNLTSKIAIGTSTWYQKGQQNNEVRAKIAERTIKTAVDSGYKMVIVDGGSEDWFLKSIEGCGAEIIPQTAKGMGAGRREVLQYIYNLNTPLIGWMEPEKEDYVKEIIKTIPPIVEGKADLVAPDRRKIISGSYIIPSYPTSQQGAEAFGNACWKELTGTNLDIWFGPRTWKRELSKYFLEYNGKNLSYLTKNGEEISYGDNWDSIFIPVMQAILDGKKIVGVNVNYTHPQSQTSFEEGNYEFTIKRLDQLNNLVPALTNYWNKNYPNSKLKEIRELS